VFDKFLNVGGTPLLVAENGRAFVAITHRHCQGMRESFDHLRAIGKAYDEGQRGRLRSFPALRFIFTSREVR
jgi:hypothetical protein